MTNNKIILTPDQRKQLEKLWFIYGNKGPKHTDYNHSFIQQILENGDDTEEYYRNAARARATQVGADWSGVFLTDECLFEVRKLISNSVL